MVGEGVKLKKHSSFLSAPSQWAVAARVTAILREKRREDEETKMGNGWRRVLGFGHFYS